ncbi:hypothetical protein O9929_08385 [Vibrio lentus]|nr:hypothetical protein [Vibrio lentus]
MDALLNRWIVPNGISFLFDHLSLPNGQQITMPFVFNACIFYQFEPVISDPAFLRRLATK